MKRIAHILISTAAALLTGAALPSCIYDDGYDTNELSDNIHLNTGTLDNSVTLVQDPDNTFRLLFWMATETEQTNRLATASETSWSVPYLSQGALQHVQFYNDAVYDTGYPYPYPDTLRLFATGYAPDGRLEPVEEKNYRVLQAKTTTTASETPAAKAEAETPSGDTEAETPSGDTEAETPSGGTTTETPSGAELSRIDFLACDYWPQVYRGSKIDPFAQPKNKLYFRHLAAKLVFIAVRDKKSMENLQHVRNVEITNLQMSTDGTTWGPLWTPCTFTWQTLTDDDFTTTYNTLISTIVAISGNDDDENTAKTRPIAGYKATEAKSFAGKPSDYVLKRDNNDRVPVDGQPIDSCYVCSPFSENATSTGGNIRLKMDISAELSFDPEFANPGQASTTTGPDGTTTTTPGNTDQDNLTFNKKWLGKVVNEIKEVTIGTDGQPTVSDTDFVTTFKPGREYRIYICFYRTGISLVAREMPWNYGGIHYITFQPTNTPDTPPAQENP